MFVSTGAPGRLVSGLTAADFEVLDSLLRRARALDPALVESDIRLAHVLGTRGELREAVSLAREALAPVDRDDPWASHSRLHESHSTSLVAELRSLAR